jgi:hypothetical protein
VLSHSPVIAQAVLAGSKSLDEAYNEVQIATGKINNDTIRLRKLRDDRLDLTKAVLHDTAAPVGLIYSNGPNRPFPHTHNERNARFYCFLVC